MTKQVKNILSFYQSENPKVIAHLTRILNQGRLGGTGKLLILPVDQGFEHGPILSFSENPPAYDPHYHFKLAIKAGCSAYAAPLGFLRAGFKEFADKIPLILKLNSSDSLYKDASAPIPALSAGVESALEMGCSAVGFTIYPGSSARKTMYEEVALISEQARKHGLPVVIWSYPRGTGISKKGETALDVVSYAAHIAAQLGAHIIKVKPPANYIENAEIKNLFQKKGLKIDKLSQRVRYIIQSAFDGKRIVVFSGGPAKDKASLIKEITALAEGGSFGSIVGRNAFKRPFDRAVDLLKEIIAIYKTKSV